MARYAPLLLLLSACSSSEPDDSLGDESGSSGDVDPGGTGSTGELEEGSSEGGSGGGTGGVDLSCLESTPVSDPTCGVVWLVASEDPMATPEDHAMPCGPWEEWTISEVGIEVELPLGGTEWAPGTSAPLDCDGSAVPWVVDRGVGAVRATMEWTSSWGSDLVYRCTNAREPVEVMPFVDLGTSGVLRMVPPTFPASGALVGECCLVSGTPSEGSNLPTDPC